MLSVFFTLFFFDVWSGVFCRFLSFLLSKGRFLGKIFGSELLFLGGCVGLVFFGGFLLLFLLHFWRFAPEAVRKNSLVVRSGVSSGLFSFPLVFFRRRRFSPFFKRQRSGSHRTPLHTHLFCCSLFLF